MICKTKHEESDASRSSIVDEARSEFAEPCSRDLSILISTEPTGSVKRPLTVRHPAKKSLTSKSFHSLTVSVLAAEIPDPTLRHRLVNHQRRFLNALNEETVLSI